MGYQRAYGAQSQGGYTLVELLLYVSLIGVLLTSVTMYLSVAIDARVKNQAITEVNDQGEAAMNYITQTIRNSSSIGSPAAGAVNASLNLTVPTASLTPTVFDLSNTMLGYNLDGGTTDSADKNTVTATKFTAGATGTVSVLYAYVGPVVAPSPNNLGQMAIYSDASGPGALLASSSSISLTPNSWNAFPVPAITVTSGQTYWLAYNTNGAANTDNDLRYHAGSSGQSMSTSQTFGSWPSSWSSKGASTEYSMYTSIESAGPTALRVREGTGVQVPLTNSRVRVGGLTFRNLTASGTPGMVQVSFIVSYINPNNASSYEYTKTFTSSAEVGW